MNHRNYEGSHILLGFIEIVGWLGATSAMVMAFYSIGNRDAVLPSSIWFAMCFSSIGLAAVCRVGRAIFDIADNTARTADLVDRLRSGRPQAADRHPDAPVTEPTSAKGWPIGQIEIYRGHVITGLQNRVFANDRYFDSVEEARIHLNSVPSRST